jgi:uncharacterized glyoxalase superfamily protein PhnB
MVLVSDDPDAVFEQAVAAGTQVGLAVEGQPYHWRFGRVVEPLRTHWEIGKPLA